MLVDEDEAATVDIDAGRLQAHAVAVGDGPDREQGMAATRHPAVVARHRHPVPIQVDALGPGPLQQPDAAAQQVVLEGRRHLGILGGQHLLAADDEGDPGPEGAEHVDELHAGHPRSDHHQVGGHAARRIGLAGRENPLPVGLGPLGYPGPAAGGDDDGVGLDLLDAVVGVGHDLVRRL